MNYFYLVLILALGLFACEKKDKTRKTLLSQRSTQLQNIDKYGVKPLHEALEKACEQLSTESQNLSQNTDPSTLLKVQNQWKTVALLFKKCELYGIGKVSESFIHYKIHRWPVNAERLESKLQSDLLLTPDEIANSGSSVIGIGALEYLLFQDNPENTLTRLKTNPKRLKYVVLIADNLTKNAKALNKTWNNYSSTFLSALESNIEGGQNQIANTLLNYLETTIKLRLEKPFGESSSKVLDKTLFEAPYSNSSLKCIKSGFEAWKQCFYGNFANSTSNYGFDDYLIALNHQKLATKIDDAIKNCDSKITNLSSIDENIERQTAEITALKDAFKSLLILLKADMASAMSITVTIGDTDGD